VLLHDLSCNYLVFEKFSSKVRKLILKLIVNLKT